MDFATILNRLEYFGNNPTPPEAGDFLASVQLAQFAVNTIVLLIEQIWGLRLAPPEETNCSLCPSHQIAGFDVCRRPPECPVRALFADYGSIALVQVNPNY